MWLFPKKYKNIIFLKFLLSFPLPFLSFPRKRESILLSLRTHYIYFFFLFLYYIHTQYCFLYYFCFYSILDTVYYLLLSCISLFFTAPPRTLINSHLQLLKEWNFNQKVRFLRGKVPIFKIVWIRGLSVFIKKIVKL